MCYVERKKRESITPRLRQNIEIGFGEDWLTIATADDDITKLSVITASWKSVKKNFLSDRIKHEYTHVCR